MDRPETKQEDTDSMNELALFREECFFYRNQLEENRGNKKLLSDWLLQPTEQQTDMKDLCCSSLETLTFHFYLQRIQVND